MLLHKQLQVSLTDPYDELKPMRKIQMMFSATLGKYKVSTAHSTRFVLNPLCSENQTFHEKKWRRAKSLQPTPKTYRAKFQ